MTIFLGIVLALFIFSVIVFFHELGHFAMAKKFGVKVDEFGIGIPPKAVQIGKDKSGTIYTLNWLPIGGFVKMKGEEMNEIEVHESSVAENENHDLKKSEEELLEVDEELKGVKTETVYESKNIIIERIHDSDSLAGKNFWQQSAVILAGVVMNFLFAFIVFSGLFMVGVEPLGINSKFPTSIETKLIPSFEEAVRIGLLKTDGLSLSPMTGSVAQKSGILENDILLSINGQPTTKPEDMISKVKDSKNALDFEVRQGTGSIRHISVTPESGKIGSYVGYNVTEISKDFRYKYGFMEAFKEGGIETYKQSAMTLELLGTLVKRIIAPHIASERTEAVKSLGGPIAIGNLFVNLLDAKVAATVIILIAALISINLGVFNLLPFPALDGGRFAFLIIQRVVGLFTKNRALSGKIEQYIHIVGFSLLILLSIFVAYQDIMKLIFK